MEARNQKKRIERGSSLVEFCLVTTVLVPTMLFFSATGLDSLRALISAQLCREAGHMFAYGVDFTTSQNQNLLVTLGRPLKMSAGAGDGSLILSSIAWVTDADCQAAKLSNCANTGHYAFTSFVQFGTRETGYLQTRLGNPPSGYITGATKMSATDYLTNTSLRADGLSSFLTLPSSGAGQVVYASELTVKPLLNVASSKGSYVRAIF